MEPIGQVLGSRYLLEERIGTGAMGSVYRARHVKIDRLFAVKILHREMLDHPGMVKRFVQEAEVAGRLQHPNVIEVIDCGEMEDGTPYTVMDLVPGRSLADAMGEPMDPERVVRIMLQLLDGLQHAHDVGLIHRDFKPENVILECDEDGSETPRIIDFGIAILHHHASSYEARDRLTTMGVVLGTPGFMAPEQARGESIDHRADLFALGVTCYAMLTGKLPFEGTGVEVLIASQRDETPAMRARVPSLTVDPLLDAFTRRLMRRNPKDRPPSASAARALLELISMDREAATLALSDDAQTTIPLRVCKTLPVVAIEPATAPHRARRMKLTGACSIVVALSAFGFVMVSATATRSAPIDLQFPSPPPAVPTSSPADSPPPSERPAAPPIPASVPTAKHARAPRIATRTADTSAVGVASLYKELGVELAALGRTHGRAAAQDLWVRYRLLRFHDTIATAASRAHGSQLLLAIQRETTRRAVR